MPKQRRLTGKIYKGRQKLGRCGKYLEQGDKILIYSGEQKSRRNTLIVLSYVAV